jgi:hypothetical protein
MMTDDRPTRNPPWSRDETILLLDLYLRAPNAGARHPDLVELSAHLNERARRSGLDPRDDFRNPTGISMKLRNMAQSDPAFIATGRAGLSNGNSINAEVWAELADDPVALAAEISRIRGAAANLRSNGPEPTKGPIPTFGRSEVERRDRKTFLYVLALNGAQPTLLPALAIEPGLAAMKVGRSQELRRRRDELNFGFPPGSTARWDVEFSFAFSGGRLAHDAEQRLLAEASARRWTIGGEFAVARPLDMLLLARSVAYSIV